MPTLEGDKKESKKGKRIKISTSDKLLPRLPVLLAQIKAGNNWHKLKKIRLIMYLLPRHSKIKIIKKKPDKNFIKMLEWWEWLSKKPN